jgi:hypothetical protein
MFFYPAQIILSESPFFNQAQQEKKEHIDPSMDDGLYVINELLDIPAKVYQCFGSKNTTYKELQFA